MIYPLNQSLFRHVLLSYPDDLDERWLLIAFCVFYSLISKLISLRSHGLEFLSIISGHKN